MASKEHAPETPATLYLRQHNVTFTEHLYNYIEHGGTAESAKQLGVDEHAVVKTLVMQDQDAKPLIILMHGDCQVSLKKFARQIGAKKVEPCKPEVAQRHTGYQVGGTSPFGTRKSLPVYVERSILAILSIYINGGCRGFLVQISPNVLTELLHAQPVDGAKE
jgi:Cys-tRNA(Pro) deacylase